MFINNCVNINKKLMLLVVFMTEDIELNAIATILAQLNQLPEERRLFVLEYVMKRLNVSSNINTAGAMFNEIQKNSVLSNDVVGDISLSIQDFMRNKAPRNNCQTIACLAFYLEKKEKMVEFGAKEIKDAAQRARLPQITTITQDIQNAQYQYHFVAPSTQDKRKKTLTVVGEEVVEALPDQEKVKTIVAEERIKIRKKLTPKKDTLSTPNEASTQ